ncbi:MAG TPA: hypothetical protein VNL14_06345, partial [Candidatus Acidoferrales bacterium]|nr:hypothetical protein [Candidatus Acidoferrales bacterium]
MNIKEVFFAQAPLWLVFALIGCAAREEKFPAAPLAEAKPSTAAESKAPAQEKAPEAKAKPVKAKGDVGLLDLEKNYLILVTKEGKLITL